MLLHCSKIFESVETCTKDKDDGAEVVDCNTSGMLSLMVPLLTRVNGTGGYTLVDFLPPWWLLLVVSNWGFFAKKAQPDTIIDNFCTLNLDPAFHLAMTPLIQVKNWGNLSEYLIK